MDVPDITAIMTGRSEPEYGSSRVRAWLATVDLARVLAASLFVAVLVLAVALWATFGLLAGALGLLIPFAAWYTALVRARAAAEAHERAVRIAAARDARTVTRPAIPTRAPLDDGGSVGPAPWRPTDGA